MDNETNGLILDKERATMLLELLTKASAPGPSALLLGGLFKDVKAISDKLNGKA